MNVDKLARMANQIAAFFAAYPEEQAIAGIRDHIRAFWAPQMIATLSEAASHDAAGLDPRAGMALRLLSDGEKPRVAPVP